MAVIQKTSFAKDLDRFNVLVNDVNPNSRYFRISELPDTLTGGKNAFLIAGSEELVPDTKIQIEIKDSIGNIIYHEPGEGMINTNISGSANTSIIAEYFEGVSKVVAIYIYPETTFGPCTLTILGEVDKYEDGNGILTPVPIDWIGKYNVKWQKQLNVNPSLANTTKIRFYQRPQAKITEILNPIYTIVSGSKVASAVTQSFANIKLSRLETFAGDVKRVKVFRTSDGDISDYDLIQDILVESKELLTSYTLSGSVVGQTGIITSETLKNYWNTGSLNAYLTSSKVESGVRLTGSGNFTYSSSLDIKSKNTYELGLDAFYSSSTSSNLGIYLSWVSSSTTFTSSLATLTGTQPTKNLLDTIIPFKIDRDYPSASLYFSQSQGEWHLGNISLKLSQDTAFSPDEISFVTTMPTDINNQTYNFKFEFYDVNNNYVPVAVTQSAVFTGGNAGATAKLLTFQTDRSAFRFSTGSYGNPANQTVKFSTQKTNLTGSLTYASSAFDIGGNYITPASYAGTYPGTLTNVSDNGALLTIANFSGSVASVLVGSIVYTASCENFIEYETIYRFEDGDNAPGVFVTANTNQFIYKATDLSLNPSGQVITIEAKRKNLASAVTPLTINSGSGKPGLTFVSTNSTNGVDTYTIAGTSYPYSTGETTYYVSGSDQFGNVFSDAIKISPVKILDGFSVAVSNENTSFPALSIGTVVGGFAASSGSITVKVGNETINYSSTFVTNSFSASISAYSGLTPNTFNGTSYSINALSADSGSLTLLVKYKDGGGTIISSSKDITYSKAKIGTPNVVIAVSPTSQTLVSNSRGSGSASPAALSVTALEGSTSRFTSIGTPTYTGGLAGSVSTNTIIFSSNASTMYSDSGSVTIPVNYTDSEGTTGTKNIVANISKAKAAAPTTLVILSSETQTILSSSAGFATPATFTTSVNEGGSNYTYDVGLVNNNNYYVSSITGGSNSSGTITPTTPTTTTGTTVSLTISYKNSEGTTGTITKTHKVAVSLEGTKGTDGTPGSPGSDGKRTATGMVFYQSSIASPGPTQPTATTYTFSTNAFAGLTSNWAIGAPTYTAGNSNKYWYSTYTAVETTAGGGTATPTFSAPAAAINFTGLVTFTGGNEITDGTTTTNIVPSGSVTNHIGGPGVTTILGSKISTGTITSTGYTLLGSDTLISGSYMGKGTIFNLDSGSIRSKNFYISKDGDAFFKGDITGASGTFSGTLQIGGTNVVAADLLRSSTNVTNALGYVPPSDGTVNTANKTAGSVGGWSIVSNAIYSGTNQQTDGYQTSGVTFASNGAIHSKNFYVNSDGTAGFKGTLTVGGTDLDATNTLNANTTAADVELGNVSNLTPQNQAQTGLIAGTTITGGGITLSGGGNIKGGQTAYNTGTGFFLGYSDSLYRFSIGNPSGDYLTYNGAGTLAVGGTINATTGVIGGWTIGGNKIYVTNKLELDAGATYPSINIFGSDGVPRVIMNNSPLLSSLTGGGAGSGTQSSNNGGNSTTNVKKYFSAIDMSTVAGAVYNLTILFTESDGNDACTFSPITSTGNISWGISIWNTALSTEGQTVYSDITATVYSDMFWSWSDLGGVNGRAAYANITGDGTTLKIRPWMRYNGSASQCRDLTFPAFTYSWVQNVSKTEIIPGGMQVVNDTASYLIARRGVTDSPSTPWLESAGNWKHNGTLITTSDRNIKKNIIPINFDLTKLNDIDGYSYDKTIDYDGDGNGDVVIPTYGIIAQEIETILPNAVTTNASDGIKGVDYNAVTGMLLSAVKKLYLKVVELENRISGSI